MMAIYTKDQSLVCPWQSRKCTNWQDRFDRPEDGRESLREVFTPHVSNLSTRMWRWDWWNVRRLSL